MYKFIIVLSSLLTLADPFEKQQLHLDQMPDINLEIESQTYISNSRFIVREIGRNYTGFFVTIVDNNNEYVLSGLSEVYVKEMKEYKSGQKIGKDYSLGIFPEFVIILYKNGDTFPQLINNKLHFHTEIGVPVYATSAGTIRNVGFAKGKGNFVVLNPSSADDINIEYCHLSTFRVVRDGKIANADMIGTTGNTGLCDKPQLELFIHTDDGYTDYKIIYIRKE